MKKANYFDKIFGFLEKNHYICIVRKKLSLTNKKNKIMNNYVNCENAKNSVAKVVTYYPACNTGKEVYFYGDYDMATED